MHLIDNLSPIREEIVQNEVLWTGTVKYYTHCAHLSFLATRPFKSNRRRNHSQRIGGYKTNAMSYDHAHHFKESSRQYTRIEKLVPHPPSAVGSADRPRISFLRQPSAPELQGGKERRRNTERGFRSEKATLERKEEQQKSSKRGQKQLPFQQPPMEREGSHRG